MNVYRPLSAIAPALVLALGISHAGASNPEFQNFFFDACNNPGGGLAQRCGETDGGLGQISTDSESSLNPSQALSSNDSALSMAVSRSKQNREESARLREEREGSDVATLEVGPFSLQFNIRYTRSDADRNPDRDAERGFKSDAWAFNLGLDHRFSDSLVVGALLGYERIDLEFDRERPGNNFQPAANAGEKESDGYSLSVFASYQFLEQFYLDSNLGVALLDYSFRRNAVFQESNRTVPQITARTKGNADGRAYWLSVNSGYYWHRGAWTYTPYAGLTWAYSAVDSYTEKDLNQSGLNMRFSRVSRASLIGNAGLMLNAAINQPFGVLVPQFRIEYEREFDRDPEKASAVFVNDLDRNRYRFKGDDPDNSYFNIGLGLVTILPNGWQPYFDAEMLLDNDSYDRYRITAGLRVEL